MGVTIGERSGSDDEMLRRALDHFSNNLRTAIPGIITAFDVATQTVTVQPALREKIRNADFSETWETLPILLDVPIVLPRAGAYMLTLPIQVGDECLVIFSDMCIDAWFSSGGVQNQIEKRRHSLSDAFAILGAWSQPNKIANYSTDSIQMRNETGTAIVEIKDNDVNITATTININGINFNTHTHIAPAGGGETSGPE